MEILQFILSYLLIGVCISFLVDISFGTIREKFESEDDDEFEWGNVERIVIILIWPYAIILLIKGILK